MDDQQLKKQRKAAVKTALVMAAVAVGIYVVFLMTGMLGAA